MWRAEIAELERRKAIAHQMGGKKEIERQHKQGKMTVRERIDTLIDNGSFRERGILTGIPTYENNELINLIPCPFVMGIAKISGRRVAVEGDDFTIKGASVEKLYKSKCAYFNKMARSFRIPIVRLVETAGGAMKEVFSRGYTEAPGLGFGDECLQNGVEMMSEIPIVAVALGSAAGLGAMYMVQSHFSIMVKKTSQVFVGGPALVQWAFGQKISKEELGGYEIHTRLTGVVDNVAEDEYDALEQVKKFLSYLPQNVWELPQGQQTDDDPERRDEELLSVIPKDTKKSYDIRKILKLVLDSDSIFEIGKDQGRSQITALARLNGYPVGVLANDPRFLAGTFNYDVAEKFSRFIDMCDTFHLPIINLSDQPGFRIGKEGELNATIRKGVRASFAPIEATVPMAVVYLRKCFGVAGAAQKSGMRLSWQFAWPSAVFGNMPLEGGIYVAHRAEIESAENPEEHLEKLQKTYRAIQSPFRTAEAFAIEDVIDPRDTRSLLCDWVEMAYDFEKTNLGVKTRGIRC